MGDADSCPVAIDLFSGVGGMSLGFKSGGFKVLAAFEAESRHVETYKLNFPETQAFTQDLSQASGDRLREMASLGDGLIDLVFGGPPCQGFSVGGRRDSKDPRNKLLLEFARIVTEIRPRFFVAENVEGLVLGYGSTIVEEFCEILRKANYEIADPIRVLDAADYGVPQRRRRVFIIGNRIGQPRLAYPTPEPLRDSKGRAYRPKVRHAISDLPEIELIEELMVRDGYPGQLGRKSLYVRTLEDLLLPEAAFSVSHSFSAPLTGCLRTKHSEDVVKRFQHTQPGKPEPISRYFRLNLNDLAPTLRAGTGRDKGSHTAPRPIHPTQPRCITVREAARLHSFPDWFRFHPSRWHAFRQIGNSVPPLLAYRVALAIRETAFPAPEDTDDAHKVRKRSGRASQVVLRGHADSRHIS